MNYTIQEENRIATNILIIKAQIIKFVLLLLYFCFAILGDQDSQAMVTLTKYTFLPYYILVFLSFFAVRKSGLEKKSSNHILLGEMIFSSLLSYLIFSRFVILFLTIPLLISTRSFERKESHRIAFLTWVGYICADVLNIHLEQVSPIFRQIHWTLIGDMWSYPTSIFKFQIIPTTLVFVLTVIITDNINRTGKTLIKRLLADTSRIAVIDSELALASGIQKDILPPGFFQTQDGGVQVDAVEKSAREVCGDFYDYIMIDDNHLAVMVADISDKGVSAAMFTMKAHTILNLALRTIPDLSEAVKTSNDLICEKNSNNFFLTVWVGVLNLADNTIEFVNCGHPMPILHNNRTTKFVETEPNLLLGCFPDAEYHSDKLQLKKGDSLILYTDGLTDILNANNESFSEARLLSTVASGVTASDKLLECCEEFAGSVPRFDDMTALALHV